ncbi:hypothetical protein F2Q70_00037113 [Brassica cretica]|uniref:Uncharacterized protein n=1 Tax=Brassica cretica TaxID=69181 RepID=A0A8S9JQ80_BRACR|nr:hypothetical protein F2Q70_00037113 [Brassica cretica]
MSIQTGIYIIIIVACLSRVILTGLPKRSLHYKKEYFYSVLTSQQRDLDRVCVCLSVVAMEIQ